MTVTLSRVVLRRCVGGLVAFVIVAGFGAEAVKAVLGPSLPVRFFGLMYEGNFPTWVAVGLLLASALMLSLVAIATYQSGERLVRYWWALSLIFAYLSLDEFVQIHERMNAWFHYDGVLLFGWIIPGTLIAATIGFVYLRFLAELDPGLRRRFILAGSLYVLGAIGMELPIGYWRTLAGRANFTHGMLDLGAESMEFTGAALFLLALVDHLAGRSGHLTIVLAPEAADDAQGVGPGR